MNLKTPKNIKKRLLLWSVIVTIILMIPLAAMYFTSEVNWSLSDFVILAAVLSGIGLVYELIGKRTDKPMYRAALGIGLTGGFLLFWVNSAVGIIGNEGHPANLLYALVFIIGISGSLATRFTAGGMAATLFTTAIIQFFIPVIAILVWPPPETSWSPGIIAVFLLNAVFVLLFIVSGLLFRRAGT